ncbi:c35ffaaa-2ff1-4a99-b2e5-0b1ffdf6cf99 [Sclerotinia trifoliorum]|uniref:C35ffaaa-2ff1-4a99-b2e5-0b1ffdf6cf99 n=1 Tax=Sclerotinia trifoliorum TaxID=28548 RepID=A0A8H2ZNK1_9HELO|nr:c35ffaaa-2ff1-4a99-b2e5-0b1ffdf6cf99 [Sclerotinia trifoliorum]
MTGESTIQKVKDALHVGGNKDHSTTGTTGTTGTTTTGGAARTGHAEGSHGPHSSSMANAADPRVDSDLDGNRLPNKTSGGYGTQDAGYGTTGTHTGSHTGTHTGTHTGAHTGTYSGTHTGTHIPGTSNTGHAEGSHGPHSSSLANAADPRVDSDLDGNRIPNKTSSGYGTQDAYGSGVGSTGTHHHQGTTAGNTVGGTGFSGGISHSTNAGPHDSNLANAADPRVDSDLSSTGNRHGASTGHSAFGVSGSHATPGSGTAQNTAGPHNSDLLNKADPRVDADLDGSKTFGGNKTYH